MKNHLRQTIIFVQLLFMNKSSRRTLSMASAFAMLLLVPGIQAAPLYEYRFNETGASATGTGSVAANGTFVGVGVRGANGSGVSGGTGDYAFDNSASTWAGTGGAVSVPNSAGALNSLSSFTLSGWYNVAAGTTSTTQSTLFYINLGNTSTNGRINSYVQRDSSGNARLNLVLDEGSNNFSTYNSILGLTSEWVFFALTYDGTLTSNNLSFYAGTTGSSVSLVSTITLNLGQTAATNNASILLGRNTSSAAFDGLLDNMRIFGSTSDSTGALTLSQLESYRSLDVVPEPSTMGLAILGLGAALAFRRNRHR